MTRMAEAPQNKLSENIQEVTLDSRLKRYKSIVSVLAKLISHAYMTALATRDA